ncbi:hypothetical protein EVAR_47624_1 [Eumeta japonica]|uniref:Uncharacterized protein n=1 Tax=Eumeta variegata TaxID=151549 RepID=A0A4C1ZS97_EUMVA|nr:hypothetical protein EVAR_47624_1 [Eumeta japonica]
MNACKLFNEFCSVYGIYAAISSVTTRLRGQVAIRDHGAWGGAVRSACAARGAGHGAAGRVVLTNLIPKLTPASNSQRQSSVRCTVVVNIHTHRGASVNYCLYTDVFTSVIHARGWPGSRCPAPPGLVGYA